jgi:hypothetical protein
MQLFEAERRLREERERQKKLHDDAMTKWSKEEDRRRKKLDDDEKKMRRKMDAEEKRLRRQLDQLTRDVKRLQGVCVCVRQSRCQDLLSAAPSLF